LRIQSGGGSVCGHGPVGRQRWEPMSRGTAAHWPAAIRRNVNGWTTGVASNSKTSKRDREGAPLSSRAIRRGYGESANGVPDSTRAGNGELRWTLLNPQWDEATARARRMFSSDAKNLRPRRNCRRAAGIRARRGYEHPCAIRFGCDPRQESHEGVVKLAAKSGRQLPGSWSPRGAGGQVWPHEAILRLPDAPGDIGRRRCAEREDGPGLALITRVFETHW